MAGGRGCARGAATGRRLGCARVRAQRAFGALPQRSRDLRAGDRPDGPCVRRQRLRRPVRRAGSASRMSRSPTNTSTTSREMFIDATLSSLPKFVGARYEAGHGNEPDPRVGHDRPGATGRARLRLADHRGRLPRRGTRARDPAGRRSRRRPPEPPRPVAGRLDDARLATPATAAGIDAQLWARGRDVVVHVAREATSSSTLRGTALDVWANEPVPRNLFVEIPPDESCSAVGRRRRLRELPDGADLRTGGHPQFRWRAHHVVARPRPVVVRRRLRRARRRARHESV